jgi:hypothetical protein
MEDLPERLGHGGGMVGAKKKAEDAAVTPDAGVRSLPRTGAPSGAPAGLIELRAAWDRNAKLGTMAGGALNAAQVARGRAGLAVVLDRSTRWPDQRAGRRRRRGRGRSP